MTTIVFTAEDKRWISEFIDELKQKGMTQLRMEWELILSQIEEGADCNK